MSTEIKELGTELMPQLQALIRLREYWEDERKRRFDELFSLRQDEDGKLQLRYQPSKTFNL